MEASEHVFVGNSINLTMADGSVHPAHEVALELRSSSPLTYGFIVALGGDFYGAKNEVPISGGLSPGDRIAKFDEAFANLDGADATERGQIIEVMDEEIAAVATAIKNNQPPSTAFDSNHLGDSLSGKWNKITYHGNWPIAGTYAGEIAAILAGIYGRYMNLATVNMDHFGDDAWKAYVAGHTAALQWSAALHGKPATADTEKNLRHAYAMNAFADHFLTDMFAGGHVRTPRRLLYQLPKTTATETGILAKAMHDEDNRDGVLCVDRTNRNDTWVAYGDGFVRDQPNADNLNRAITAVQTSADLVHEAYVNGWFDQTHSTMLNLIPIAGGMAGPGDPVKGPDIRTAPLFYSDSYNKLHRRDAITDPTDYSFTEDWWVATTASALLAAKYLGLNSKSIPAPV